MYFSIVLNKGTEEGERREGKGERREGKGESREGKGESREGRGESREGSPSTGKNNFIKKINNRLENNLPKIAIEVTSGVS